MKIPILLLAILFALFGGCAKTTDPTAGVPEIPFSDLAGYKMKILPADATAGSSFALVVFDDCGYNRLTSVQKNGSLIEIDKQFNSRMMVPCLLRNDTIQLGILSKGTYRIVYKLMDVATPNDPRITFSLSFKLPVL